MRIPTDDDVLSLHKKYAPNPGAFDLVYTHCQIICGIARQLHSHPQTDQDIDMDLVQAGSLLHDIGVYRLYDEDGKLDRTDYIRHGVLGYELLQEEGFPETICRFASHHTGVGLTRNDVIAEGLPLPPVDYLAETGEERLVMYADKFHSKKTPPVFFTAPVYATRIGRFGPGKVAAFEAMRTAFGDPDLLPFSEIYGYGIVGQP